ncbi:Vacuolar protein sorting-associated protein 16-like [Hondaea fermentalgiana]|uniref:Vacuolar protein sorting-associated protein 16-like n=1 Tax=Hondaea fermentalgiana TaxID=2315210 RepID=A0A2R5GDK7_9STRA|nr:Vacuolar protein sorting-associated protein 16-like [Hondaea fermentalgiana]|eukprot:GBG29036.1 Vacuolar protein sorting-associated protein 16-like [Hondaea fermentalgiana]
MEAEGAWQSARGTAFHRELACDLEWKEESARERRRQRRRKRSRDLKAASPLGAFVAVLTVDDFALEDDDGTGVGDQARGRLALSPALIRRSSSIPEGQVAAAAAAAQGAAVSGGKLPGDPDVIDDFDGELHVFTSTGKPVFSRPWYEGHIAPGGFGWTQGGLLVCVLAEGDTVVVFRANQDGAPRILTLPTQGNQRIACAHVWAGGFVAITHDLEVVEGFHLDDPIRGTITVRAQLSPVLVGGDGATSPQVISVLRPFVSRDDPGRATIVVGNPSRAGIIAVESGGTMRSQFALSDEVSRSLFLVPHPTYRLIASYGEDGVLSVLPMDFCQVLVRHDCSHGMQHTGLVVLSMEHEYALLSAAHLRGSEALDGAMQDRALQTDPDRAAVFELPPGCRAFEEADGVRIVGGDKSWMVRQVPESYHRVFGLGSTDPGAMLLDTVEMLDGGDADADAGLRALVDSDKVADAVNACLDAAEHATGVSGTQQLLLRAASYGKRFLPASLAGRKSLRTRRRLARRFVEVCRLCRLCRAARVEAGMAITTKQLRVMTPRVLIDRLLFAGQFHLASRLCQLAHVSTSHVVTQWAAAKIRLTPLDETALGEGAESAATGISAPSESTAAGSNEALIEMISARVEACRRKDGTRVPFATLAAVAASLGRNSLAIRLCDRETQLSRRVLLLLKVEDYEGALRTIATETGGDPDLHMFTIARCTSVLPVSRIVALAAGSARLRELFTLFFRSTDKTMYKRLLLGLDAKREKAFVLADESCMSLRAETRADLVQEASNELAACGNRGLAALAADHARLVRKQNELGESLIGLSLADTILDCFRRGLDEDAEKFARDFNFPEKAYRRVQLRGLAARKAWPRIEELSTQAAVRAVLDDADFAEVCLLGGQREEAARFARNVEDANERKAALLLRLGLYEESIDAAFKIGNTSVMEAVRRREPSMDSKVREKLEELAQHGPPIKTASTRDRAPLAALNAARDKAAQGCAQQ